MASFDWEALMHRLFVGGALGLGLALATAAVAQEAATPLVKGTPVTLSGCVVGADSDSYVLTRVERLSPRVAPTAGMLGATGMEGAEGEVIYWLSHDSVKKMRNHNGRRVEIMGTITDISMGTVETTKEPGKVGRDNKIEVDARGKEASARTDRSVDSAPTPPPGTKVVEKKTLPTYRVEVDTVRVLEPVCP
jgi:hypothetical protein